jgi:hypothetical protein
MSQFRTVEIDFDVHKCIENERRSFEEPPNNALRRLLGLPELAPEHGREDASRSRSPWSEDGASLPHGTPIRILYARGRQKYDGHVENGKLAFGSLAFDTLSGAASSLARTRKGERTRLNGWLYGYYKEPASGKWLLVDELRRNAQARSGESG